MKIFSELKVKAIKLSLKSLLKVIAGLGFNYSHLYEYLECRSMDQRKKMPDCIYLRFISLFSF